MKNLQEVVLDIKTSLSDSFSIEYLTDFSFAAQGWYRLNFNQLILVEKGKGQLQIDDTEYEVNAGELVLIAKNQIYSLLQNESLEGYSLCFGDCFWDKTPVSANNCKALLFNSGTVYPLIRPASTELTSLLKLFKDMLAEFQSADYSNKGDVLAAFLKILIIKIANLYTLLAENSAQDDQKLYQRFIDLLAAQYDTSHDVTFFAGQLNISNRKLTELCRKYAGKGAKEVINLQLVTEAKRFLQFSTSPIKEIASRLNFSSSYQFSHFFKKNTSFPPETYRKQFNNIDI